MYKLNAQNITKSYKNTEVLHGVSLEVNSGEVVGLLGPNGAGKTTTFYIVCGLVEANSGEVKINDELLSHLSLHQRAKKGIGYLPQESSIFKELSVEDNLYIAAEASQLDESEIEKNVEELLELFNIEPIRKRKGVKLSGGERRRVEIARALINKPKFLLLDEPFAGVDPIAISDIQHIIKELVKLDIGILITDHNVRETLSICDSAYVIKNGTVLASGSATTISDNKDVKMHYLGENFKL